MKRSRMKRSHTHESDEAGAATRGPWRWQTQQKTQTDDLPVETAATATLTNETRQQSAAAHACSCATDALGVIFSFLPLVDVASSAAACRRWSDAIAAAKVGRHHITVTSVRTLRDIAESPLRCLVGAVDISLTTLMAADRIESLWSAFPHLTALTFSIDWRYLTEETTLCFPVTLRSLSVYLHDSRPGGSFRWSPVDVLLSLAVRCPLRRLRVCRRPQVDEADEAPPIGTIQKLLHIKDTLTELELEVKGTSESSRWESVHLAVFRSLTHLTRLHASLGEWSPQELDLLMATPTSLSHLCSLDLQATDLSVPALSAALPLLSDLDLADLPHDPTPLAHMTQLETLQVDLYGTPEDFERLRVLLRECLPAMVRLRTLTFSGVSVDLADLSAAPHLADTLEMIRLESHSLASLIHLRTLRHLRSVRLDLNFDLRATSNLRSAVRYDDRETIFLPALEKLTIDIDCESDEEEESKDSEDEDEDYDFLGFIFGRLPALRYFEVFCAEESPGSPSRRLMPFLRRQTELVSLTTHHCIESAGLVRVMPAMPHLRKIHIKPYRGGDLSIFSSSAALARSIERLTLHAHSGPPMHPRELIHLRSLSALHFLDLFLGFQWPSASGGACEWQLQVACATAPVFASLRELRLCATRAHGDDRIPPFTQQAIDLACLLGPMPHLRVAHIDCVRLVQAASIADVLVRSTQLTKLRLVHTDLTDAHLTAILRPLVRLCWLEVSSSSLDGLSFASAVPHLAHGLEALTITGVRRIPSRVPTARHLSHLRTLGHLRCLSVGVRATSEEVGMIDEYDTNHPNFQRDIWAHMSTAVITRQIVEGDE